MVIRQEDTVADWKHCQRPFFAPSLHEMFSPELYHPLYHHALLALTLLSATIYATQTSGVITKNTLSYNNGMLWGFGATFAVLIGTRPISGYYFADMSTYAQSFDMVSSGQFEVWSSDPGFALLTRICANTMSVDGYFLVCAVFYIAPVLIATRLMQSEWAFAALLAFAGGFSFYSYGVNGIRNGIATSFLLWALACHKRKLVMLMLMAIAISFHTSVILPAIAFAACCIYINLGLCSAIWISALATSLLYGESVSLLLGSFISLGSEERLLKYTTGAGFGGDKGGFRLDFILYGILPLIVSYALADKAIRSDKFYRRLVGAYLLTNAFWLLAMYAAFSNRLAYLSWFMMPLIVIYPFIPSGHKSPIEKRYAWRPILLPAALIAHYSFTYFMQMFVYQSRG